MDDRCTVFFVIFFTDPHSGKGWKMRKNGTSNPYRVFSFSGSVNFNFHFCWGKVLHFLFKSLRDTIIHSTTTRHDHVFIKISSDINITFHDWAESKFMDLGDLSSYCSKRIEKSFRASELLVTNGDDVSIWEFILLFFGRWIFIFLHFLLEVKSNVT